MAKIGNLKCKVGTYQKDGQEKGKYVDVGALMQGQDGGMFVLMSTTFNPAGDPNPENKESILVSVFMDDNQNGNNQNGNNQGGYNQNQSPQQQQGYQQPQTQYQDNNGQNVSQQQYNQNQNGNGQ